MNAFALFGLQDEQLARLVYLLGVLVLVAGGLRFARGRLGQTLKQAAIWLAIIAALVVVYAYRDPLMRVAGPVLSELNPGRTSVVVDAGGAQALVYRRASDGHFHVDGEVDGVRVDFLVDTGATTSVLTYEDAARAGIDVDGLVFNRQVYTANGVAHAAGARVDRLAIGPFEARDVRFGVMRSGQLRGSLLGLNVLDRFGSLEVSGDRLTLTPAVR